MTLEHTLSTQEAPQSRFEFDEATEEKFEAHCVANPLIYSVLERFALEAIRSGRTRIGIKMLYERARWYSTVETKDDSFKLNNNWTAYYARKLMTENPELEGLFELRRQTSRSDA